MPETVGALVAFLFFITPGLTFELFRERARPSRKMSAFRETANAVVASVGFSTSALLVMLAIRMHSPPWFPDPEQLAEAPSRYASENLWLVSRTVAVVVLLAVLFAWLWHRVLCKVRPSAHMGSQSVWFELLHGRLRPKKSIPIGFIELSDGSAVRGHITDYALTEDGELGTLVLGGTDRYELQVRRAGSETSESQPGWVSIVVEGDQLVRVNLAYLTPPA